MAGDASRARGYHDATKHAFHRYARSLGYLDWATQPDPFRRYDGAALTPLPRTDDMPAGPAFDRAGIGALLRYSLGLSAWKQYGSSRWALRVNPSSGNLHPTEAYVVWNGAVWHYDPREHALEQRCHLRTAPPALAQGAVLVGLTSIHWREAWKYGERAFRYCQHDAGHAIAALRFAAAMLGWRLALLPTWAHADVSALLGVDRDDDFGDAEREDAECLALIWPDDAAMPEASEPAEWVAAARAGEWTGRANRLSPERVEWPIIDEVAAHTRTPGRAQIARSGPADPAGRLQPFAPSLILQRRSALGFNPRGVLTREAFFSMLARLQSGAAPWDAIDWPPQVHLALFVHRVQDVTPGIYAYVRDAAALPALQAAMRPEFIWESIAPSAPSHPPHPLYLLAPIDVRATANRLSCNQDIAEDGFFSLGMLARFDGALEEFGEPFYRNLFWETGMIGQVLYLEAEAAGARATGIGCFFDDHVHELLGLTGHAWQSLYHFSMGLPVDDGRLTTEPGYDW